MNRVSFIWNLLLVTSMIPHILSGQNNDLIFQRFSIQEGLSHNSVLSIIQDRRGFIWIATYDGLNRFDGYQFKEYNHDYRDTTTMSQNLAMALHEDSKGRIWVGTPGMGLCRFDPLTDKFTRYTTTFEENGEKKEVPTISAIQEDLEGNIWFGSISGLFKLEPDSKSPIQFSLGSNRPIINSLTLDTSGNIWVGTFDGLFKIPYHDNTSFIRWKHDPDAPASIVSDNVMSVFEDHRGTFWIG